MFADISGHLSLAARLGERNGARARVRPAGLEGNACGLTLAGRLVGAQRGRVINSEPKAKTGNGRT